MPELTAEHASPELRWFLRCRIAEMEQEKPRTKQGRESLRAAIHELERELAKVTH